MKKILLSLLFLFVVLQACNSTKKTSIQPKEEIISIEAKNLPQQVAYVTDIDKKTHVINKLMDGQFADTLQLPEGFYKINIGQEYSDIYLKPGMNLKISVDGNEFDETIHYEGTGADVNNFLAANMLADEKDKAKYDLQKLVFLPEKDFVKTVDSLYKRKLEKLKKSGIKDKNFIELQSKKYLVDRNSLLLQYPNYKTYIEKKPYKVSSDYPQALEGLDIKDSRLIKVPGYLNLVKSYLLKDMDQTMLKDDFMYGMISNAEKKLSDNPSLKEYVIAQIAEEGIGYTKHLKDFYNVFTRNVKDPEKRKTIENKYNQLLKLQPGNPSPDFTAYDINGKEYHLSDFKGKNVYIDLWATWCAPCRMEIPYLEKLKKDYEGKNIEFISIDVYDDKAKWEKMVKSGKITGVQLIIPDRNAEFLKIYDVRGIPRFIFIDKEGKIINQNVSRPSNPATRQLIDKYVNE